jgi:hypothetical protein
VKSNPNLKGDQLTKALEQQNWDPSVRSLANFPSVLQMMDGKLEWTQNLGDAFLGQKDQVIDTIQSLRNKAYTQGNLKTTSEQKVVVQEKTIVIQPANPEVVYVPAYNPTVVYGPWGYPSYPPYAYYPYGYTPGAAAFSFVSGVAVGAAWGYAWGGFDWGRRDVDIDINRNTNINNNINRSKHVNKVSTGQGGKGSWKHDADHRKGVAYRDNKTRQEFGKDRKGVDDRKDFRGHDTKDRPGAGKDIAARDRDRPSPDRGKDTPGRDLSGKDRPGRDTATRDRPTAAQAKDVQGDRKAAQKPRTASALEGADRGARETKVASDRGNASRQSMSKPKAASGGGQVSRPSGGGDKGGAARQGGGGGGKGKKGR